MDNEDIIDLIEAHSGELTTCDFIQLHEQFVTEMITLRRISWKLIPKQIKLLTIIKILSKVEDIVDWVENFDPYSKSLFQEKHN